jgi:hypothetical protein
MRRKAMQNKEMGYGRKISAAVRLRPLAPLAQSARIFPKS